MKLQISNQAFWDIDFSSMDDVKNASFIIARVFQYGNVSDIRSVIKFYEKEIITESLKSYRGLDNRTSDFAKVLGYL